MSDSNDPVLITGSQLIELIRPVILAHTKHEGYTNLILEMIDDGARMRLNYNHLSPAAALAYVATNLLDPIDPTVIEVFSGILLDRLRTCEPPADLPQRADWLSCRDGLLQQQAEAISLGAMADVEVHSINASNMEVDWSQLEGLGVDEGGTNG